MILTSVRVLLANLMGVVSSNIFRDKNAPKHAPAPAATAALGGTGAIIAIMADNKLRDTKQGVRLKVRDISTEWLRKGPAEWGFGGCGEKHGAPSTGGNCPEISSVNRQLAVASFSRVAAVRHQFPSSINVHRVRPSTSPPSSAPSYPSLLP